MGNSFLRMVIDGDKLMVCVLFWNRNVFRRIGLIIEILGVVWCI